MVFAVEPFLTNLELEKVFAVYSDIGSLRHGGSGEKHGRNREGGNLFHKASLLYTILNVMLERRFWIKAGVQKGEKAMRRGTRQTTLSFEDISYG